MVETEWRGPAVRFRRGRLRAMEKGRTERRLPPAVAGPAPAMTAQSCNADGAGRQGGAEEPGLWMDLEGGLERQKGGPGRPAEEGTIGRGGSSRLSADPILLRNRRSLPLRRHATISLDNETRSCCRVSQPLQSP